MSTETRTIYAIDSGLTVAGYVLRRGESITLNAAQIEDTKDRNGVSWLDQTDEDQIANYGSVRYGHGEPPADLHAWQDDILAREGARNAEREDALRIVERTTRAARLAEIDEKYGRPSTQFTIRVERGDEQ